MGKKGLPVVVWKEGRWFVAKILGFELASQGLTKKEAIKNLREAFALLLEDEDVKIPSFSVPEDPEVTTLYA